MRLLYVLSLALSLTACDSASDLDLDPIDLDGLSQDPTALVGTWDWVASVSYFTLDGTPALSTPASTGRSLTYVFDADGTVQITGFEQRATFARETTYTVERRTYGNGTTATRPSLRFGDGGSEEFGTSGDLLVLDSTPVDGPQMRFRKR